MEGRNTIERVGYGRGGANSPPDDLSCFAKTLTDTADKTVFYHVRRYNDGRLVDPAEFVLGAERKRDDGLGRDRYPFRVVRKEAFDAYLKYLRTNNKAYYHVANRENW